MRVVLLDPNIHARLRVDDPVRLWQKELLAANLLVDIGQAQGPIAAQFRELMVGVGELERLEASIIRYSHRIPWLEGGVPNAAWGIMGGTTLLFILVWNTFMAACATPLVLGSLALGGLYIAWRQNGERVVALQAAQQGRQEKAAQMRGLVITLINQSFVLWTPTAWVVSAPHRAWLMLRLRELMESRRPKETPERRALMAEMRAEIDRMEALCRIEEKPPDASLLETQVDVWEARLAALSQAEGIT